MILIETVKPWEREAVKPLITILDWAKEIQIQRKIINNLCRIGTEEAANALIDFFYIHIKDGIGGYIKVNLSEIFDNQKTDYLIKVLENEEIGSEATYVLSTRKDITQYAEKIISLLRSDKQKIRENAELVLERMPYIEVVDGLIKLLGDKNFRALREVILIFKSIRNRYVFDKLFEGLRNQEPQIRWYAAIILGYLKSKKAIKPLQQALQNEKTNVRTAIINALGKITGDVIA